MTEARSQDRFQFFPLFSLFFSLFVLFLANQQNISSAYRVPQQADIPAVDIIPHFTLKLPFPSQLCWQIYMKFSPYANLTTHRKIAAMISDNTVANRKPQPCIFIPGLCCIERIEYLWKHILWNFCPSVFHHDSEPLYSIFLIKLAVIFIILNPCTLGYFAFSASLEFMSKFMITCWI